jgi:hypothetical protein
MQFNLYPHSLTEAEFSDDNWEKKVFRVFLLAIHSTSIPDLTPPPPPPRKSCLKVVCNISIEYGNLKSDISQGYAKKPQQNCRFMNSASVL